MNVIVLVAHVRDIRPDVINGSAVARMLLMDAHDIAPQLKSHSRLMKPDAEIIIFKAVSDNAFIKQAEICHVLPLN